MLAAPGRIRVSLKRGVSILAESTCLRGKRRVWCTRWGVGVAQGPGQGWVGRGGHMVRGWPVREGSSN